MSDENRKESMEKLLMDFEDAKKHMEETNREHIYFMIAKTDADIEIKKDVPINKNPDTYSKLSEYDVKKLSKNSKDIEKLTKGKSKERISPPIYNINIYLPNMKYVDEDIYLNERYSMCSKLIQDDIDNQRIVDSRDVLDKFHMCMK